MINGLRLKQVRELLGLTQNELALKLSVTQSTVAYLEGGYLQPSEELLSSICDCTGFPQSFFEKIDVTEFPYGSLLYRSRTSVDALEKNRANRYGQFMFEVAERLSRRLKYRHFTLPKGRIDAVMAARVTRSNLGYGPDRPIDDLIYELEKNGVFIFKSPVLFPKVDAFSVWGGYDDKKPVIVLTGDAPADRVRWSVAHELGHLILHSTLFGDLQEFEREADMFASEFLLPEETMSRIVVEPFTLIAAARIKSDWKVSIQAIVRRAHDLHLISSSTYKSLFVQISQQKKKLQALVSSEVPEQPRSLRGMAEAVYGKKINYRQFSDDTNFPVSLLRQFIEAQASREEYTRQERQQGRILEFPSDKNPDGGETTDILEG
jgi:Zn-dependent peptidase ImmA (M78 family)/transcriptional regulator with XRE-family HTH domain